MFTVSVILVCGSKYVQFRIICSLLCSTTINTFKVDPHSIQYEKSLVKPTNSVHITMANFSQYFRAKINRSTSQVRGLLSILYAGILDT